MISSHLSVYAVIMGRTLAGLAVGILLAVIGDVLARVLNLVVGFPWSLEVHQNIQVIGIGLGAGLGTYFAWASFNLRWYWTTGSLLLILSGGIFGAYLGDIYGPGPDPTYWWSSYATDKTVYPAAALGGLAIATMLGLYRELIWRRGGNPPKPWLGQS